MSSVSPRPSRRPGTPILRAILLAGLFGSQAIWVAPVSAAAPDSGAKAASAGLEPTVHWEEAVAHEADQIAFTAGARATVGFTPRSSDRWKVGGVEPRPLPAGRLDGRQMRRDAHGPATDPAVDQPIVDPASVIPAVGAAWVSDPVPGEVGTQARVDPGALRREVFGFLPYWQVNSSSLAIQYDKISTIAYFGVGADGAGNLVKKNANGSITTGWSGWTSSKMTSIINKAHSTGTRVVLTVQSFAWNTSGTTRQKQLLGNASARLRLARQIAAAIRDRGADGVNLDFEPLAAGYGPQFTAFVRTLRAELDKVHKGYQLTFDTTGYIGNYPLEDATAPGGADAIFIMGYDYRGSTSTPVGSVAPLRRTGYDIRDTVAAYAARVPASKLILGVPYYGRAWSTDTSLANAKNISGSKYGASATVIYTSALTYLAAHGRRYDTTEHVAWTAYRRQNCTATYGCLNPWRQLYVDDARALAAKYALVNEYGLRGSGIWALGYDGTRPELWQAIADAFVTDSVPPRVTSSAVSSTYVSPNADGRNDTVAITIAATGHVRWGYEVAPVASGFVGAQIRAGVVESRTVRLVWDGQAHGGSSVPDGRYRLTIWLGDASDNRTTRTFDIIRDTSPIAVTTRATPWVFTPDGDGRGDTTVLSWSSAESGSSSGRVFAAKGTTARTWSKVGTAGSLTWNGRNNAGKWLPSGTYTYRAITFDKAGNRTIVDRPVAIDKTIVSLTWSSSRVRKGTAVTTTYRIRRPAAVTLAIYRGTSVVRLVYADRNLAAGTYSWRWDGRDANGVLLPRGIYKAAITVRSSIATTKLSRSVTVE